MKYLSALCLLLLVAGTHASESIKVYRTVVSDYDATVIVMPTDKENTYLLHFKGFEHELDDDVRQYKKILNDPKAPNAGFYFQVDGLNEVNFRNNNKETLLSGTTQPYYEATLPGKASAKLIFSHLGDYREENLLTKKYNAKQGNVISKVEAKRMIKKAQTSFEEQCGHTIKLNIDWTAFSASGEKTAPSMLASYYKALTTVCAIDSDYKQAVTSLVNLNVIPSQIDGTHRATRSGNILKLELNSKVPNVAESSYELIYNAF